MKAFAVKSLKTLALVVGLSMTLGSLPASAVEQQSEPSACDKCGPAPCCMVLWVAWCGCPFADSASLQSTAQASTESCRAGGTVSSLRQLESEEALACFPEVAMASGTSADRSSMSKTL